MCVEVGCCRRHPVALPVLHAMGLPNLAYVYVERMVMRSSGITKMPSRLVGNCRDWGAPAEEWVHGESGGQPGPLCTVSPEMHLPARPSAPGALSALSPLFNPPPQTLTESPAPGSPVYRQGRLTGFGEGQAGASTERRCHAACSDTHTCLHYHSLSWAGRAASGGQG